MVVLSRVLVLWCLKGFPNTNKAVNIPLLLTPRFFREFTLVQFPPPSAETLDHALPQGSGHTPFMHFWEMVGITQNVVEIVS